MNRIKNKRQGIGKRVPCFWDDGAYDGDGDGDDIAAVAEILIQLPELISRAQSSPSLVWGAKRRRSAISAAGTKNFVDAAAATSPATPLMFSPSESDDKANNNNDTPSRVSPISKRKNKELMQSVTDLTHQKHSLVKEMEAAKCHLDVLRASDFDLKRRKQVIIYGYSQPSLQTLQQQQQHQQIHYPFQMQHPSTQWSMLLSSVPAVNKMGPVGLPDLNLTLEEAASNVNGLLGVGVGGYQASDVTIGMDYNVNSRALASAQARKRRMQIYKEKNQNQVLRQR